MTGEANPVESQGDGLDEDRRISGRPERLDVRAGDLGLRRRQILARLLVAIAAMVRAGIARRMVVACGRLFSRPVVMPTIMPNCRGGEVVVSVMFRCFGSVRGRAVRVVPAASEDDVSRHRKQRQHLDRTRDHQRTNSEQLSTVIIAKRPKRSIADATEDYLKVAVSLRETKH